MADVSVGSGENPRVYRGPQRRRPQRMSGIEVQRFQHACRNGFRTYDNQTEEIQLSRRTTYKAPVLRVTAAVTIIRQLSDQRYDGCIPSTIAISDHHPTITGTPVRTPSTLVAPGGHNAGTIWSVGYAGKYLVVQRQFRKSQREDIWG